MPTLAGAGAIRSTANDLLKFLAANLGYTETPLAQAMADEISIRKRVGSDMEIAYAWHVQTKDGQSIIWHNGGTGGIPIVYRIRSEGPHRGGGAGELLDRRGRGRYRAAL